MPARCRGALALAAAALAVLPGCGDSGGGQVLGDDEAPVTVQQGPVAAVAVATGDCLNGIVIGVAERREIDSAQVVSCEHDHALEVYATFELDRDALALDEDVDLTAYPGRARVVAAADQGCSERIEALVEEPEAFGLIALWPSEASWPSGDRAVACAVFSPDGTSFDERQL